jgi:hypothetical protein
MRSRNVDWRRQGRCNRRLRGVRGKVDGSSEENQSESCLQWRNSWSRQSGTSERQREDRRRMEKEQRRVSEA